MALGYSQPLYVLAFDHRGSFQSKLLGIPGTPTDEEVAKILRAKQVIYAGFLRAWLDGAGLRGCLELGAACGAISTRAAGGVDAQPTLAEAQAALAGQATPAP